MKFKLFYLILPLFVLPLFIQAQDDEAAIRSLVQDMVQTVDNLKSNLDAKRYLGHFTPNYQAIRSDYLVDGTVEHHTVTLETMTRRLQNFAMNIDQDVDYKLDKINYLEVLGNTAVVNVSVNFSISDKGSLVFGGVQNITETLVKTDHGWKVSRSHITEVRNSMQKYTCNYEQYSKGKGASLLKIHYPSGRAFETDYLDVTIEEAGAKNFVVMTNRGDQLEWQNDRLYLPDPKSNMTRTVTATNQVDVYNALVVYYHPEHCSEAAHKK